MNCLNSTVHKFPSKTGPSTSLSKAANHHYWKNHKTKICNLVSVCLSAVIHSVNTYPISIKLDRMTNGHTMEVVATYFAPLMMSPSLNVKCIFMLHPCLASCIFMFFLMHIQALPMCCVISAGRGQGQFFPAWRDVWLRVEKAWFLLSHLECFKIKESDLNLQVLVSCLEHSFLKESGHVGHSRKPLPKKVFCLG